MKTKLTFLLIMFISIMTFAQNGINYKAVIKDDLGNVVANDLIVVQFIILDGATNVYQESHSPTTDDNGVIIINIGEGTPISGTFSTIDWSSNNHFLNVQINTGSGLQDMGTTAFKTVPYAMIAKDVENEIWSVNGTRIYYDTNNVGVGLNNPLNPFSVLQPTGTANTVRIESQSHPSGKDLLELQIPTGSSASSQFIEMQNGTSIVAVVNGDGSANFSKVGINGSPIAKLHIFQGSQNVGTGLRFTDGTANSDWDITHGFALRFHYGSTLKGFINANTGAYTQSSDISLKSNIQNMNSTLDRVKQLRPTSYYYNDDESQTKALGFIAQEVESIFPEVVHYSEPDGLYGIDYATFGVIAIKAIQEQQTIIEDQQKQIDELKVLVQSILNK